MPYNRLTFTSACTDASLTPITAKAIADRVTKTWSQNDPEGCWERAYALLSKKTKSELLELNAKHDPNFGKAYDYGRIEQLTTEHGLNSSSMIRLMEQNRPTKLSPINYVRTASQILALTRDQINELNEMPEYRLDSLVKSPGSVEIGTAHNVTDPFSAEVLQQLPRTAPKRDEFVINYAPGRKLSENISENASLSWRTGKTQEEQDGELKELVRTAYDPVPDDSPEIAKMKERRRNQR